MSFLKKRQLVGSFLGVDSPFFPTKVLFEHRPFFSGLLGGFLERFGSLGSEWGSIGSNHLGSTGGDLDAPEVAPWSWAMDLTNRPDLI